MGIISYIVVTGVGTIVTSTGIGAEILPYIGFSSAGPMVGSIAAGAQAYVGNIAAGSLFATLQSIAMTAPTP